MDTQKNQTRERFELSYIHEEYGTTHGRIMFDGVELMDFWINLITGEKAIKYTDSEEIIGAKVGYPFPQTPLEGKSTKQIMVERYVKSMGDLPGGIPGGIFKFEAFDPVYFCVEIFSRYGDANHIARCIQNDLGENKMVFWRLEGKEEVKVKYISKDDANGIAEFETYPEWHAIYNPSSFDEIFDEIFDVLSEPLQPSRSRRFLLRDEMKADKLIKKEKPDIFPVLIKAMSDVAKRRSISTS